MWQERTSHLICWTKQFGKDEEKKEKRERKKEEREASHSLYNFRQSDSRFSSEQESKFVHVMGASHRDQNLGFLPSSER